MTGLGQRLLAMARNFSALSDSNWEGLELQDVLHTELEPFLPKNSHRISMSGPKFRLSIKSSKDASMIFHELATNASKYGFLTTPDGRLSVDWDFDGAFLKVSWNETGLVDLQEPKREGFGFQMMDMFQNLGLTKTFESDGLKLTAMIPASIVAGQITFAHNGQ